MNKFLVLALLVTLVSCDRKPFVEHKLALEKKGDDCSKWQGAFRMNSNFGGERFEFEKCLPVDKAKDLVTERHGDTVLVQFPKAGAGVNALYQVTLDIDSYPKYNFITIDGDTYAIAPAN